MPKRLLLRINPLQGPSVDWRSAPLVMERCHWWKALLATSVMLVLIQSKQKLLCFIFLLSSLFNSSMCTECCGYKMNGALENRNTCVQMIDFQILFRSANVRRLLELHIHAELVIQSCSCLLAAIPFEFFNEIPLQALKVQQKKCMWMIFC